MNIRFLGLQDYLPIWESMKTFTDTRDAQTLDEVWFLEHPAVYTQGQAGKAEHVLKRNDIPLIQTDRGGQVTYHGPGQIIAYCLFDLERRKLGIRTLVNQLETCLIQLLNLFQIDAQRRCKAPGLYVEEKKIASIGLRVRKSCTYHGIALNVNMDLSPFELIHPCGFSSLKMTNMSHYHPNIQTHEVLSPLTDLFCNTFGP